MPTVITHWQELLMEALSRYTYLQRDQILRLGIASKYTLSPNVVARLKELQYIEATNIHEGRKKDFQDVLSLTRKGARALAKLKGVPTSQIPYPKPKELYSLKQHTQTDRSPAQSPQKARRFGHLSSDYQIGITFLSPLGALRL